jgi:hypothetical protein
MSTSALTIEKKQKPSPFDDIVLREFQNTFFISEICDFADAFIAVKKWRWYATNQK